jgi:hypothetical protein
MIDSWVDNSNILQTLKVGAREKVIIHSSVGEWHLHAMINDIEDRKKWETAGIKFYNIIGKFRSQPSANGDYSWLECENIFNCTYSELDEKNNIKGLITFSKKNIL